MKTFNDWFNEPGAYVLVDGQFGSTGKGLLAGVIAEQCAERITHVTTNAGPNSGHTAYFDNSKHHIKPFGDEALYEKVMTQQIPVASVFLRRMGLQPTTLLNAGAVIDSDILLSECLKYDMTLTHTLIHPCAALITADDRRADAETVGHIAGTGKGIGPALMNKIRRHGTLARDYYMPMLPEGFSADKDWDNFWDWGHDRVFVETAQGFSLGINSAKFYPYVTSRECTVMQALADARIAAQMLRKVVACYRTYPIRVGNTPTGRSGDCYADQTELTWEQLNIEPELTTVTKRVRRVFSWSRTQFKESIAANRPDVLFINFAQYLEPSKFEELLVTIREDYWAVMRSDPDDILIGSGPYSHNVETL